MTVGLWLALPCVHYPTTGVKTHDDYCTKVSVTQKGHYTSTYTFYTGGQINGPAIELIVLRSM